METRGHLSFVAVTASHAMRADAEAANSTRWPNAALMLGQRRRWDSIKTALGERLIMMWRLIGTGVS